MLENFIYVKEEALDRATCQNAIEDFERIVSTRVNDRLHLTDAKSVTPGGSLLRDDLQLYMPYHMEQHFDTFQQCIFDGLMEYSDVISTVKNGVLESSKCKFQKTPVGGGFHYWHTEQGSGTGAGSRCLAWMIYMNDVTDGGDTEFLYQQIKVQPKAGTLVIWPAGITHPHRGNPPYSNEKYVVTGWFRYVSQELFEASRDTVK